MKNRIKNLFMAGVMLGALGLASVVQAVPVWAATVEEYARQCAAKGGSYNVQQGCIKTETVTKTMAARDCNAQGGSIQGGVRSNGDAVCSITTKTEIDGPWKTTPPTDGGGQEYKGPDYNSNGGGDGTSPTESDIKYTGDGKDGYSYGYGLDSKDTLSTSVLDCSDSGNGEGIFCILNIGLTVLTWGVGIAGTLGIVICGIQYLTARDSVDQAAKAKNRLVNIIVGLVIYAVMWGFLTWLIPGGLF